jgi:hypothetical protein
MAMLYSRISNQGGRLSSLHSQFPSPTCYCLLDTQLYKPMALMWHSAVSVSGKGGEKTGENDLDSDTSLVHSQLRVRGDVSPGQYHSTVGVYSLVSYQ